MAVEAVSLARRELRAGQGLAGARARVVPGAVACAGVCVIALAAPFEPLRPLVRLPFQALSALEAVMLAVFAAWAVGLLAARRLPLLRTPLTAPWVVMLAAMAAAAAFAPQHAKNAANMAGRFGLALGLFLLTVNAVTTAGRLRGATIAIASSGAVSALIILLEYFDAGGISGLLVVFRDRAAVIGAHIRPGGSFQYPTIASMYLEIAFAIGLGLLLAAVDAGRRAAAVLAAAAAVLTAQGIMLTFTRAGLITMAASLLGVGWIRYRHRGLEKGGAAIAGIALAAALLFLSSRSFELLQLRMTSEGQDHWYRAEVSAPAAVDLRTGGTTTIDVIVTNVGRSTWNAEDAQPFFLSYHWLLPDDDRVMSWEGLRTPLPATVGPGESTPVRARVQSPRRPGEFRLMWDIVQEHRLWFSTEPAAALQVTRATVSGAPVSTGAVERLMPLPRTAVRPGRLVLWSAAARMLLERPLLGVGPDNYRLLYGPYARLPRFDPRVHSNNMYIEVLVGAGLLGGLAFGWLCWRTARLFGRIAARWPARPVEGLASGVAAAGVAIAVHGVFDSFLSFTATYQLIAITLGLGVACAALREPYAHRI